MTDEEMRQRHEALRNENLTEWQAALRQVFGTTPPRHAEWTGMKDVVSVLRALKPTKPGFGPAHMFYPSGGGNDLEDVRPSVEDGCIELRCGVTTVAKVGTLTFESFDGDSTNEWAYFRLDCAELEPTGLYEESSFDHEEVTELAPGEYDVRGSWDRDEDSHGNELPDTARPLSRYFRGAFVFFAKMSIYNSSHGGIDAYRAIHNVSADKFRAFIQSRV